MQDAGLHPAADIHSPVDAQGRPLPVCPDATSLTPIPGLHGHVRTCDKTLQPQECRLTAKVPTAARGPRSVPTSGRWPASQGLRATSPCSGAAAPTTLTAGLASGAVCTPVVRPCRHRIAPRQPRPSQLQVCLPWVPASAAATELCHDMCVQCVQARAASPCRRVGAHHWLWLPPPPPPGPCPLDLDVPLKTSAVLAGPADPPEHAQRFRQLLMSWTPRDILSGTRAWTKQKKAQMT